MRLRQSVFCINAKTCPLRTWTKRFRGAAPEDTHGNPSPGVLLFFHSAPYFILVSGEAAAVPGAGFRPSGPLAFSGWMGEEEAALITEDYDKRYRFCMVSLKMVTNNMIDRMPAQIPSMRFGLATATKGTV